MSESKASVTWQENKAFMGVSPSGHNVQIDADKEKGASPMELVLLGLGGCASYDVVSILQKSRQDVTDVRCELTAKRAETVPAVYTDIHLHFVVTGQEIKARAQVPGSSPFRLAPERASTEPARQCRGKYRRCGHGK